MDEWEIFSELCRRVVEEQNVYLVVDIMPEIIKMRLMPVDEEVDDDE